MVGSRDLEPSTKSFGSIFYYNQFRAQTVWPASGTNLASKTAIITGGNAGLGFEAAQQLLDLSLSHIVLAVRSLDRGQQAAAKLREKHAGANIDVWELDMASYQSVQAFADRTRTLSRIDFVLLNAGVIKGQFTTAETGHEETLQVNYLSNVLLALLLLPILKEKGLRSDPPHLSFASAALSLAAKFPNKAARPLLPSFDVKKDYDPAAQYDSSKLLMHMFLWKLGDYVSANDVIVNLPDPAWCKGTALGRDFTGMVGIFLQIFALTGRSPRVGASCFVDALVNKGKESHGCFIMSWQVHPLV